MIGCNTRRYHGLLVAATRPPTERMVLVSKLDETIVFTNRSGCLESPEYGGNRSGRWERPDRTIRYELGTNNYGNVIHPHGYQYLINFSKEFFPEFIYEIDGIILRKTVAMVHHENITVIIYDVLKADEIFTLELVPFLSVRGYHNLMRSNDNIHHEVSFENDIFKTKAYEGTPEIFIKVPGADYDHKPGWYYNFHYSAEEYRGLDFIEDLFTHGKFSVALKNGDSIAIIISTDHPVVKDGHELFAAETLRRQLLLHDQPQDETLKTLILAADQFIVKRELSSPTGTDEEGATIIAGYHWFTDWGRDTMISLPGLCLATGRFEDAKKILIAFAKSVSEGMLPTRFRDNGEPPEYNNVDGTLWYFISVYKYLKATKDKQFVLDQILPVLHDIIEWHQKGTRFNIHVTADGLLYSGEEGVQLTWMDAKIDDWVVTPRSGKAVEVNALWYNALCIYSEILAMDNKIKEAKEIGDKAAITRESFNQQFWNSQSGYLYDVIENEAKDDTLRPNQLFAIGLPFPLVEGHRAHSIVTIITEKLYTPVGLRSLPADHPKYVGVYGGDALHRDSSYHQGTVWSWLLGIYVDAIMKIENSTSPHGERSRTTLRFGEASKIIDAFKYHLNEGCIGSVSEIFDSDPPHHPRGCVAQAWGVGELLRVIVDYGLYCVPE